MTLDHWLVTRRPVAPRALRNRVLDLLARQVELPGADVADACLAAGEGVLAQLLSDGCTQREAALDLLAVDALVTYAFEAAAESPESLDERAHQAMLRISGLASTRG